MYQTINESEFRSAFHSCGRGEQFSYEGLTILFEGLEQYEVDNAEPFELDVIALCCDFSELTEEEIQRQYGIEHDIEDESDLAKAVESYLNDNTWVLGSHEKDGMKHYIFQQF